MNRKLLNGLLVASLAIGSAMSGPHVRTLTRIFMHN